MKVKKNCGCGGLLGRVVACELKRLLRFYLRNTWQNKVTHALLDKNIKPTSLSDVGLIFLS